MFTIGKDKIIGALIMLVGLAIAILYTLGSIVDLFLEAKGFGGGFTMPIISPWTTENWGFDIFSWKLFVVLPLWLLVVLVCIIAIWIGYSPLILIGERLQYVNDSSTSTSRSEITHFAYFSKS